MLGLNYPNPIKETNVLLKNSTINAYIQLCHSSSKLNGIASSNRWKVIEGNQPGVSDREF